VPRLVRQILAFFDSNAESVARFDLQFKEPMRRDPSSPERELAAAIKRAADARDKLIPEEAPDPEDPDAVAAYQAAVEEAAAVEREMLANATAFAEAMRESPDFNPAGYLDDTNAPNRVQYMIGNQWAVPAMRYVAFAGKQG
jgi:hypothetical protein